MKPSSKAEGDSLPLSVERFTQPIAKPEWLDAGLESSMKTFRLAREGRIPESIKAWMLTVACMRVLRAINGSDLDTVIELRKKVLNDAARFVEQEVSERERGKGSSSRTNRVKSAKKTKGK